MEWSVSKEKEERWSRMVREQPVQDILKEVFGVQGSTEGLAHQNE